MLSNSDKRFQLSVLSNRKYQIGNRLKLMKGMSLMYVNITDITFANRKQMLMITVNSYNCVKVSC